MIPDESKDLILRKYEEKINRQLIEVIQADLMNPPLAVMRAGLARLMLRYIAKVTEELDESFKQIEKNIDKLM